MVEIDVAESSDGALFLLHDTTLDRTTTGSGPLSDQTSAGILNFFLKDSHERIPRFREALDLARETGLYLMLDVKSAALDKVWAEVSDAGMGNRVLILTFSERRTQEAFAVSREWLVSVLIQQERDVGLHLGSAPVREGVLFYINQRAEQRLFEAAAQSGIPTITDAMRFLDAKASAEGGHHYREFLETRRPRILVSDFPLQARAAVE